ncbi:MAG: hypothetical protein LBP78_00710 [Acidaminococcales bacterium]|jgi:hypothetical protein|nr:hypothetical protein [Acidaminococcales bacterium]
MKVDNPRYFVVQYFHYDTGFPAENQLPGKAVSLKLFIGLSAFVVFPLRPVLAVLPEPFGNFLLFLHIGIGAGNETSAKGRNAGTAGAVEIKNRPPYRIYHRTGPYPASAACPFGSEHSAGLDSCWMKSRSTRCHGKIVAESKKEENGFGLNTCTSGGNIFSGRNGYGFDKMQKRF